jgi:hypothetical protein
MWRDSDHRIKAAEGPLNFRIALSGAVCILGIVLLFFIPAPGIAILGGGILGLIANLWAKDNRDSPWVHGMESSDTYESPDPRMDQAFEYKRLLDGGLITHHDYQVAIKSLYPHLPTPEAGEQEVSPNALPTASSRWHDR